MNKAISIILLLLVTGLSAGGASVTQAFGGSGFADINETENATGSFGVEYTVEFSEEANQVEVTAHNPTSKDQITGFELRVDGYRNRNENLNLSQNETWNESWDFSNSIDATVDRHKVKFSTIGDSIQFNFTREIDLSNSSEVPTPRITNVEVTNGTVYGNETAVVEVTVENPADQLYGSSLMVHTLGTNFSRRGDAVAAPGNKSTVQVPLEEPRGTTIAGEVRLYDRNLSEADDGFDQREFVGRAGGDTQVWNRTYEPADPHWAESGGYRYENETMEERIDDGDGESSVPLTAVLVAGITVLLALLVWRFR